MAPRTPFPIRELAFGVAVAFLLIGSLFAPLWMLELGLLAMSGWLLWWIARAPLGRIASGRRIPRLTVFVPLGIGVAANVYLVGVAGRVGLVVNLVLLAGSLAIGMFRIARQPAPS